MRPSVLQSISKDKNVMARTRKYYLKNHYLTLRSKVKVPRRSLRYATHHLVVIHPHTKYYWPISKDKIVMAWTRKYYLKNNYLTLRSKVRVQWRSLRYATHRLMVIHPHTKYHWPISKETIIWPWGQRSRSHEGHYGMRHTTYGHAPTFQISLTYLERKKCYGPDKKILFKKQLFDLEVKILRRSLRYATHRLMVMHLHSKYHWPISNDKNVMARIRKYYLKNNYLT
jgi:hypothetical protein